MEYTREELIQKMLDFKDEGSLVFMSSTTLPDFPDWHNYPEWVEDLNLAIARGCKYIFGIDNILYEIISKDRVKNIIYNK